VPGNVASVFSAGGAGGPITIIVVVVSEVDDHGALLSGRRRGVHRLRSVHGLLGSIHGLHGSTVHPIIKPFIP
jgi:hypothetical protein